MMSIFSFCPNVNMNPNSVIRRLGEYTVAVVSVGDLEPGSIPSRDGHGGMSLGQGTLSSLVLVCLPGGHE